MTYNTQHTNIHPYIQHTDIATTRLNRPWVRFNENHVVCVYILFLSFKSRMSRMSGMSGMSGCGVVEVLVSVTGAMLDCATLVTQLVSLQYKLHHYSCTATIQVTPLQLHSYNTSYTTTATQLHYKLQQPLLHSSQYSSAVIHSALENQSHLPRTTTPSARVRRRYPAMPDTQPCQISNHARCPALPDTQPCQIPSLARYLTMPDNQPCLIPSHARYPAMPNT